MGIWHNILEWCASIQIQRLYDIKMFTICHFHDGKYVWVISLLLMQECPLLMYEYCSNSSIYFTNWITISLNEFFCHICSVNNFRIYFSGLYQTVYWLENPYFSVCRWMVACFNEFTTVFYSRYNDTSATECVINMEKTFVWVLSFVTSIQNITNWIELHKTLLYE